MLASRRTTACSTRNPESRFSKHTLNQHLEALACRIIAYEKSAARLGNLGHTELAADDDALGACSSRKLGAVRACHAHLRAAMYGQRRRHVTHQLHDCQVLFNDTAINRYPTSL